MKRSGPLARRTPLKRGTKKLPALNVRRATRKRDREAQERKSPEWRALRKQALERAEYRCEWEGFLPWPIRDMWCRCPETQGLEVHHLRYTKIRKSTTLGDVQVLCRVHHREAESAMPYRAARRQALASKRAS